MNPPSIFISATSGDLRSARQTAKDALLTINCHPVEQSHFEPDWRTVTDMLRAKISGCQALIHLVGHRYGAEPDPATLPPGTPRRSYTQMEYHLARELGLRVYTFLLPDTYPYDTAEKPDTAEQAALQAEHRALIEAGAHLYEKPANAMDLRLRIVALQEKVIGLEVEQQSIAKEVSTSRRWGLWAAAAILLLLGGVGVWQWEAHQQTSEKVSDISKKQDVISQKQDEQSRLLMDQSTLLREAVVQLEQLTEEKAKLGIKITDLPREEVEKELAARLGVSAVELHLNIEAGKKSQDALTRAHANLLAGKLAEAHTAAKEVRDAEAPAIERIILSHLVDAQAYYQELKYESALDSLQKTVALVDKNDKPLDWAKAQSLATNFLYQLRRYREAESITRECIRLREQHLGQNHSDLATSLNDLAAIFLHTNRLAEAEPLMRRVLKIDETNFGPNHPTVARDLNNLAQLLEDTDRKTEAEALMRRGVTISENQGGKPLPDYGSSLANLAMLLKDTNRLPEAESLLQQALKIEEASHGPDHPNVAIVLNNLALLFHDTKRKAEAEPLMRRALKIEEACFGPENLRVATPLGNLAQLLQTTNRLEEAEPLMRRALKIKETSLGPDHPDVATALGNLGRLLQLMNQLPEAEPLMRRSLQMKESIHGRNHASVASDLNNLALLLQSTDRLGEAEPLMRRAVEILYRSQAQTGLPHKDTPLFSSNYFLLARKMKVADKDIHAQLDKVRQDAGLESATFETIWQDVLQKMTLFAQTTTEYLLYLRREGIAETDIHTQVDKIRQKAGLEGAGFEVIWQEVLAKNPIGPFQVVITEVVKGGQGEALGLRAGDVYVSYNGQSFNDANQFVRLVGEAKGDAVPLEVLRDGKKLTFTVKPGKLLTRIENRTLPPAAGSGPAK